MYRDLSPALWRRFQPVASCAWAKYPEIMVLWTDGTGDSLNSCTVGRGRWWRRSVDRDDGEVVVSKVGVAELPLVTETRGSAGGRGGGTLVGKVEVLENLLDQKWIIDGRYYTDSRVPAARAGEDLVAKTALQNGRPVQVTVAKGGLGGSAGAGLGGAALPGGVGEDRDQRCAQGQCCRHRPWCGYTGGACI